MLRVFSFHAVIINGKQKNDVPNLGHRSFAEIHSPIVLFVSHRIQCKLHAAGYILNSMSLTDAEIADWWMDQAPVFAKANDLRVGDVVTRLTGRITDDADFYVVLDTKPGVRQYGAPTVELQVLHLKKRQTTTWNATAVEAFWRHQQSPSE